jgi:hypothetical protein
LEAVISNAPLKTLSKEEIEVLKTWVNDFVAKVKADPESIKKIQPSSPTHSRVIESYGKILTAMSKRQLIEVQTGLQIYPRMAITNFAPKRDERTGLSLWFNLDLTEVMTVEAQATTIAKGAVPKTALGTGTTTKKKKTKAQATRTASKGRKPTKTANTSQQKVASKVRGKSWLKRFIG